MRLGNGKTTLFERFYRRFFLAFESGTLYRPSMRLTVP